MEPIHIVTEKTNIADVVLMPGDPLRAKYIAENFLTDYKLVNEIRNIYAYTGYYNGKRVTVCASGMGCPSIGIYAYELYDFYDVKKIIRIGTSGAISKDVKILDVVLSNSVYSESSFAYQYNRFNEHVVLPSNNLNEQIKNTAMEAQKVIKEGMILTSDIFNVYVNTDHIMDECPYKDKLLAVEMEGFALFYVAQQLKKEAAMLLTIVDSPYEPDNYITPEDRQTSLNEMIKLALDAIIK